MSTAEDTTTENPWGKAPENPFLTLTLKDRLALDETKLSAADLALLHEADEKRVDDAAELVVELASGAVTRLVAGFSGSATRAAKTGTGAAARLLNGFRRAAAAAAAAGTGEAERGDPDSPVFITRDEAVQLIGALSGALADTEADEEINFGEILDNVAGNEESAVA